MFANLKEGDELNEQMKRYEEDYDEILNKVDHDEGDLWLNIWYLFNALQEFTRVIRQIKNWEKKLWEIKLQSNVIKIRC